MVVKFLIYLLLNCTKNNCVLWKGNGITEFSYVFRTNLCYLQIYNNVQLNML